MRPSNSLAVGKSSNLFDRRLISTTFQASVSIHLPFSKIKPFSQTAQSAVPGPQQERQALVHLAIRKKKSLIPHDSLLKSSSNVEVNKISADFALCHNY